MDEVKEVIDLIPEETKKEIYNDLAKPTLVETGRTLSIFPRVIKNALMKVEMWCLNREFAIEKFKIELAQKLEKIKEEDIVDADPRIFIPSAQAISYSWEHEEIKNLYMNLMASDMNKNIKEQVHPSFTEVIKQMDSTDVKVFTTIYKNTILPICSIKQKRSKNGVSNVLDYLLPDYYYSFGTENLIIKSLNNLERLKLINIDMMSSYTNEDNYLIIKSGEHIKKYKQELKDNIELMDGVIEKTEFGKDFYDVCCK